MYKDSLQSFLIYRDRARTLERRWQELCARFLPVAPKDSIWRYNRVRGPGDPAQGWKLHISATVLDAVKVLERVAPFLAAHAVQFKAPRSLRELGKINSGLYYGYSQVGKFITVYPGTPEEAVGLARRLHELTRNTAGPAVPFDLRYGAAGNVYYRFGAFEHLELEHPNGQRTLAIRDPKGELVPDVRESERARPDWVLDPFEGLSERPRLATRKSQNPPATAFRVFRALTQRGKGGVYQAVDLGADPPRLCLLKEGRKYGEITWDGRDGSWRVRNEERVLSRLIESGVAAPRVYSSFEIDGNYYLVTEFIEGECLQNMLCRLKRRIPISRVLRYGIQLSNIFSQIHAAGWVWRDCKPINILVTPEGTLRPVDFEGACPVDQPDPMLWGTPGFSPPEGRDLNPQTGAHYDLYALGSMLYLLLTGIVPEATGPLPIEKLRPHVPSEVRLLITQLLSHSPERRPCAERVARGLKAALRLYERREQARHSVSVQVETGRDALKRGDGRGARKPSRRRSQTHISPAAAAAG